MEDEERRLLPAVSVGQLARAFTELVREYVDSWLRIMPAWGMWILVAICAGLYLFIEFGEAATWFASIIGMPVTEPVQAVLVALALAAGRELTGRRRHSEAVERKAQEVIEGLQPDFDIYREPRPAEIDVLNLELIEGRMGDFERQVMDLVIERLAATGDWTGMRYHTRSIGEIFDAELRAYVATLDAATQRQLMRQQRLITLHLVPTQARIDRIREDAEARRLR